ncbi:MAG: hypothetical protein V4691_03255 [Pseudomonadota bacterium]
MSHDLTLYYDQKTGISLMVASSKDETIYFPYNIDTGKFSYGMHGSPIKGLPIKYFQALTPQLKRGAAEFERDLQVIKMPQKAAA